MKGSHRQNLQTAILHVIAKQEEYALYAILDMQILQIIIHDIHFLLTTVRNNLLDIARENGGNSRGRESREERVRKREQVEINK